MSVTAGMMARVNEIAAFIRTGDDSHVAQTFTDDAVIVENFAPHIFRGPQGLSRWRKGVREHTANLSDLAATFGPPQDFGRTDDTVFFTLPTHWAGKAGGRPFSEDGGWAFVLRETGGGFRVAAYAWAVTGIRHS